MNTRERLLAITVIGIVIVAGLGVMFYQFYLSPYRTRETNLTQLRKQTEAKEARINEIAAQRAQLERYRQESLPADLDVAKVQYTRYLEGLLRENGFKEISVAPRPVNSRGAPTLGNKTPIYTQLGYTVQGRATLQSLVGMMDKFYRTGLLHQIKTVTVQRPLTTQQGQRQDELDVNLTIEALVVAGADKRATLMPTVDKRLAAVDALTAMRSGPAGLGGALWAVGPLGPHGPGVLAEPERDYAAMRFKNIFFGPPTPQVAQRNETEIEALRYTILNEITTTHIGSGRRQAMLYDQSSNEKSRLKTMGGFNTFPLVRNSQGLTLVHGEVVQINDRGLVFRVGLNASEPEDKSPYYTDRDKIYNLRKEEFDNLTREGAVRSDDASRVFWVDKGRWEFLIADKMVTVNGRAFAFRWDLVKGYVIRDDGKGVTLRVDDKYCAYRYTGEGGQGGGRPARPHEGYCTLHIGGNVADALHTPLKEDEIKKILTVDRR
jgi:hypothetical protein